jgi:hypothetical protein
MSPAEREFMTQYVVKDFNDPNNQYGSIHIEVADPDKSDFTVIDLRNKAELLRAKDPSISMIVVDHAGLMAPRNRQPSTTERLNEVVRDLKRLSMSFDRGAGIAVLNLFQISREGYKAAEKGGGSYNLTHLSYANECERSSDIVTAAWIDEELRSKNVLRLQCLKARDDKPFDPFYAGVVFDCRRIHTAYDITIERAQQAGNEIDLGV